MPERFVGVPDPERGEWLRPMETEPLGGILSVVPRGFEAYARVFHPVDRDRPRDTMTWQGVARDGAHHMGEGRRIVRHDRARRGAVRTARAA